MSKYLILLLKWYCHNYVVHLVAEIGIGNLSFKKASQTRLSFNFCQIFGIIWWIFQNKNMMNQFIKRGKNWQQMKKSFDWITTFNQFLQSTALWVVNTKSGNPLLPLTFCFQPGFDIVLDLNFYFFFLGKQYYGIEVYSRMATCLRTIASKAKNWQVWKSFWPNFI